MTSHERVLQLAPYATALLALGCSLACAGPTHLLHREPTGGRPLWLLEPEQDPACTTVARAVVSADVRVDVEQAQGEALLGARYLVAQQLERLPAETQVRIQGYENDYFHEGANGESDRLAPVRVHVRVSACEERRFSPMLHEGTEFVVPRASDAQQTE